MEGINKVELQEGEYRDQVETARDILNEFYFDSRPLLMLGYNGAQISALHSVYSAVEEGNAINADRNLGYPVWAHTVSFENFYGTLGIDFPGNGDYQVSGTVNEEIELNRNFPIGTNPHLFLLYRPNNQDNDLKSISQRIFRGRYAGESNFIKDALANIVAIREHPRIKSAFKAEWLDEETKMDAVFYFPVLNRYTVFRKVMSNESYETWGKRINITSKEIEERLVNKESSRILRFESSPSF